MKLVVMNFCGRPDPCRASMYCGQPAGHDGGCVFDLQRVTEYTIREEALTDEDKARAITCLRRLRNIAVAGGETKHETRVTIEACAKELERAIFTRWVASDRVVAADDLSRAEARLRLAIGALRDGEVALAHLVRGLRQLESSDARRIPSILPRSAEDAITTIQREARVT